MTQGTGGISNGEMMVRWLDSDEKIIDLLQGCGAAIACFVLRILKPYIKNFEYAKTQVMHQAMPAGGFLNYHPVYTRNMSYNLYQNGDTYCISGPYLRSLHIQGDRIREEAFL
ncbi:hypothetical protein POTOM_044167 [Populus tomentosa]|uniref:Uncharacterized protein n=1 Tax=Populus tomentosa TaxID=118781 RepID=A0A8X7YMW2_POPTO|nr:hypothetical protein POTOM_044167 [Populus tomentosa]